MTREPITKEVIVEDTEQRNQEIEEMLREAKVAEEPGELAKQPVIHGGDEGQPSPMIGRVKSAGYTWVYDTKTGIPSKINNNNIRAVLRKKRPDGTYVFGLKQTVKPREGTFKCLLHKDDPNREHYDFLGLAVCPKGNLASTYQVRRHMQKRHKMEWDAIEQERIDREKKEDREFQQKLMGRAIGVDTIGTAEAPLYVSNKDKKKVKTK